jgi:hypothetical protein
VASDVVGSSIVESPSSSMGEALELIILMAVRNLAISWLKNPENPP